LNEYICFNSIMYILQLFSFPIIVYCLVLKNTEIKGPMPAKLGNVPNMRLGSGMRDPGSVMRKQNIIIIILELNTLFNKHYCSSVIDPDQHVLVP
jgi:hypothetical protein